MSRCWIALAVAGVMTIGLPARAQNNSSDWTSAPMEQAKRQKEDGDRRLRAGDTKGAEAAYRKAAQLDPSLYDTHEALGNLLFSNNRYLEAVEAFQKAIQAEPRYVIGFYNVAYAYRKAGKFNEAISFYRKYLEKKPDDPDAYFGLGASYEAVGQKQAALDNYLLYAGKETRPSERQYVIKANDKAEELRKALGKSPPTSPTGTAATPVVQATEDQEPSPGRSDILPPPRAPTGSKEVMTLLRDGDAAMKEQSYIKAMKAYYDAVKAEPGNPDALYRLGLAYEVNGNPKAAALRFRQALNVDPNYAAAAKALARIEGRPALAPALNAEPSAQPKSTPVVISAPPATKGEDTPVASTRQPAVFPATGSKQVRELINDGDAAFQKNNFYVAITHFLHASQLDPNNEEALYKLGLSYALSKNHQMAIFKWQKVLAINPTNEMAKRNIAIAEQNLKGGTASYQMDSRR